MQKGWPKTVDLTVERSKTCDIAHDGTWEMKFFVTDSQCGSDYIAPANYFDES